MSAPRLPRRPGARGFSFVEILVVMGIIAVLVSLGLVAYNIAFKKTPEIKTKALLQKIAGKTEHWKGRFGTYPPGDPTKIALVTGTQFAVAKLQDLRNIGIESIYLSLEMPGWGQAADLGDLEIGNTDGDVLEKPPAPTLRPDLFEVVDAWGNPLVYFHNQDYVTADKTPPTYVLGDEGEGRHVQPRPWRLEKTGDFAQKRSFQLFSMGPDQEPNTEDDLKAWE